MMGGVMSHGARGDCPTISGRESAVEGGQSTVEYAMVLLAFLASIVALGMVLEWGATGGFLEEAIGSASHLAGQGLVGTLQDVLLY